MNQFSKFLRQLLRFEECKRVTQSYFSGDVSKGVILKKVVSETRCKDSKCFSLYVSGRFRGGRRGLLEPPPPLDPNYFIFMGNFKNYV